MTNQAHALFHLPLEGVGSASVPTASTCEPGGGPNLHPHPIRLRSASLRYAGSTSPQGGGERHTVALTGGISQ